MLVRKWWIVCRVAVAVGGGREVRFQDKLGSLCKCWVPDDRCLLVLLVVGGVEGAEDRLVLVPGSVVCVLILTCGVGGVGCCAVLLCLVV